MPRVWAAVPFGRGCLVPLTTALPGQVSQSGGTASSTPSPVSWGGWEGVVGWHSAFRLGLVVKTSLGSVGGASCSGGGRLPSPAVILART